MIGQFLNKDLDFNDHFKRAKRYIKIPNTFTKRFAYVLFINKLASDKAHLNDILSLIKDSTDYYVEMAIAWLLAELCVYHEKEISKYIKEAKINNDIKRMAINKIRDSFRISDKVKEDLKEYRKEL